MKRLQIQVLLSIILCLLLLNGCTGQASQNTGNGIKSDSTISTPDVNKINANNAATDTEIDYPALALKEYDAKEYQKASDDAYKSIQLAPEYTNLTDAQKGVLYKEFITLAACQEHLNNYDSAEHTFTITVQVFPEHKEEIKECFLECMKDQADYMRKQNLQQSNQ